MTTNRRRKGKQDRQPWQLEDVCRLNTLWEERASHLTKRDLADRLNISPGAVSQFFNGETALTWSAVLALCELLKVSPEEVSPTLAAKNMLPAIPGAIQVRAYHPEDPVPAGFVLLPALEMQVGAGHRIVITENPDVKFRFYGLESLQKHHLRASDLVAFRVGGSSMEPYIFDGDWVVIDRSRVVPPSVAKPLHCRCNTFVFRYEDGIMVKMLQTLPDGGLNVVSLNTNEHKEFTIPAVSVDQLEIFGKVVDRSGWAL